MVSRLEPDVCPGCDSVSSRICSRSKWGCDMPAVTELSRVASWPPNTDAQPKLTMATYLPAGPDMPDHPDQGDRAGAHSRHAFKCMHVHALQHHLISCGECRLWYTRCSTEVMMAPEGARAVAELDTSLTLRHVKAQGPRQSVVRDDVVYGTAALDNDGGVGGGCACVGSAMPPSTAPIATIVAPLHANVHSHLHNAALAASAISRARAQIHAVRHCASVASRMPKRVKIWEVGLRDGLQNEGVLVSAELKVAFAARLAQAGMRHIELTSFVSPRAVPQFADASEVLAQTLRKSAEMSSTAGVKESSPNISVLVPNEKGLKAALAASASACGSAAPTGLREIAIFAAASEAFSKSNINCTIDESLARFAALIPQARAHNIRVRGYVSCVFGCPYEGKVSLDSVLRVTRALLELGCYEISLGDTIGVSTPVHVTELLQHLRRNGVGIDQLAMHFHDTRGTALANVYAALLEGVSTYDASIGGLGGCPFAKGATGNVATEDMVWMLTEMGIDLGEVNFPELIRIGNDLTASVGRSNLSHVSQCTPEAQ
ncbi:Hydroxymethylglutaryl-CoA lyase, mitochondrial [Porphyridium purpureum]|uniref:hydroxymethylglutaryl-CoA lyase n=1 Tax=Porphyridium purpureum TaxID=35688 RepID=A0A5J4Z831_PORPP|nr:Hydroxymethylglutaryl-CoA lyase, mitochondrial [Porphyridium purpureum]|eukprot:POR7615..scf295_1